MGRDQRAKQKRIKFFKMFRRPIKDVTFEDTYRELIEEIRRDESSI